ncbi:MAG TPA: ParA family protein [Phycisphaerales bacterium]|nr:ParA family protein [Phycisphaerales bacterium]
MFDSRVTLSSEVKADIEKFLENAKGTDCPWSDAEIIPTHVRRNIKLAEAPSYGKTIFEYEPKCHGSNDYEKIAQHIASMKNGQNTPKETAQIEPEAIKLPETTQNQAPTPLSS